MDAVVTKNVNVNQFAAHATNPLIFLPRQIVEFIFQTMAERFGRVQI